MRCLKGHRSYYSLNLQIGLLTNMQITTTLEWSVPSLKRIRSRIFEKVFQELLCPKFLPHCCFIFLQMFLKTVFQSFLLHCLYIQGSYLYILGSLLPQNMCYPEGQSSFKEYQNGWRECSSDTKTNSLLSPASAI